MNNDELEKLKEQIFKLESENFKFRRENLKQAIELLSLKDDEFSHIDIKSIDDDGLEVLDRMHNTIGEDGLKHWLLKLFPQPEYEILGKRIRMLSEVDDYLKSLKPPRGYSKL